jgi:hypothetical protein
MLATLAACEIEEIAIPRTESRVAMHAVLSATAETQVVLLERTRDGSFDILAGGFDLADPLVSDEGIAESGAIVHLTTPDGSMLVAREDRTVRQDRKGQGIYRFDLPGSALVRNGRYELRVQTTDGTILTAETSVPEGTAAPAATERVFDRSSDEVVLEWPSVTGARSYLVRIESPFGPRWFFTDTTFVRLTGDLRNIEIAGIPRVFIPGFPQAVTVSAVDSNFYDWYRTHNNVFSGEGIISRVTGGIGVFGSLVRLRFEEFDVVVPQVEPEAGSFVFAGTPEQQASTPYLSLELYVESRASRDDQADALSGRSVKRPSFPPVGCQTCGLLGSSQGNIVRLAFLSGWSAQDTADVFTGELRGDTLVGSYRTAGGNVRFVRQR